MTLFSIEKDQTLLYFCNSAEYCIRQGGKDAMDDLSHLCKRISAEEKIKIPGSKLLNKLLPQPITSHKYDEESKRTDEQKIVKPTVLSSRQRLNLERKVMKEIRKIGSFTSTKLLRNAIIHGNVDEAKKILATSSAPPNLNQFIGRVKLDEGFSQKLTPFSFACLKGDLDAIQFLIENKADITFRDEGLLSPRTAISLTKDEKKAEEKMDKKIEITSIYENALSDFLCRIEFTNFPPRVCMIVAKYL